MTTDELIKELDEIGFERRDSVVCDGSTMIYSVSLYGLSSVKVQAIYFSLFDGWQTLWKFHHREGHFYHWNLTRNEWMLIEDEDLSVEAIILLYREVCD